MHQEITVELDEVRQVVTGNHGSVDYRGTVGVSGNGYILTRLTFYCDGVIFSIRGRAREIRNLMHLIDSLATSAQNGLTASRVVSPQFPDPPPVPADPPLGHAEVVESSGKDERTEGT
jgi:hypothetical protein